MGPSVKLIFQGRNKLEKAPSVLKIDTYMVNTHIVYYIIRWESRAYVL